MISDRSYMRKPMQNAENYNQLFAVRFLLYANIAVFILGSIFQNFFFPDALTRYFAFSESNLFSGKIWSVLTYSFLHGGIVHLAVNMLVLWFACRGFEYRYGSQKTFVVYFTSAVGGALFYLLISLLMGSDVPLVGASAGVAGLLSAFLFSLPNEKLSFAIFGIIPLSVRPRAILAFIAISEFLGMLFVEISPSRLGDGVGYSAHIGGILTGIMCAVLICKKLKLSSIFNGGQKNIGRASDYKFQVNIASNDELRKRTNEILDKIKEKGFYSLTDEEKDILNEAKDRL